MTAPGVQTARPELKKKTLCQRPRTRALGALRTAAPPPRARLRLPSHVQRAAPTVRSAWLPSPGCGHVSSPKMNLVLVGTSSHEGSLDVKHKCLRVPFLSR